MMNNVVIKSIKKEDGPKIIEWFKSVGVDTGRLSGIYSENGDDINIYYGVIDTLFGAYTINHVQEANATIIPLPFTPFKEREMLVWDDSESRAIKRVVFNVKNGVYLAWCDSETIKESLKQHNVTPWKNAKELPQKVTLTIDQIAEKFGIDKDLIEIK